MLELWGKDCKIAAILVVLTTGSTILELECIRHFQQNSHADVT